MAGTELNRQFGLRVKVLRSKAGLTQQQLADAINKSLETVGSIERGISSTRIETAARIAEAVNVSLPDLFEDSLVARQPAKRQKLLNTLAQELSDLDDARAVEVVQIATRIVRLARKG